MDAKLINPVLNTIVNVLSTMANVQASMGKPSLKEGQQALGAVTGIMNMVSPNVRASLAISFAQTTIFDIVKRILGEEITELGDTAKDMTGEMTNMVVGGAKNLYLEQGYDFDMSTPDILMGDDHLVQHACNGRTLLLPFTSESGEFFVEICFED